MWEDYFNIFFILKKSSLMTHFLPVIISVNEKYTSFLENREVYIVRDLS